MVGRVSRVGTVGIVVVTVGRVENVLIGGRVLACRTGLGLLRWDLGGPLFLPCSLKMGSIKTRLKSLEVLLLGLGLRLEWGCLILTGITSKTAGSSSWSKPERPWPLLLRLECFGRRWRNSPKTSPILVRALRSSRCSNESTSRTSSISSSESIAITPPFVLNNLKPLLFPAKTNKHFY